MAWIYVPEAVSGASHSSAPVSAEQSATSSATSIASGSSSSGSETGGCPPRQSGMTCAHLTGDPGVDAWISSLAASRANLGVWPASSKEPPTSAIFGESSGGCLAKWDPGLRWLRMCPASSVPEEMRAYAAGLMDGEGCIAISESNKSGSCYYCLEVDIGMSKPGIPAMDRMQEWFGGKVSKRRDATMRWQSAYAWRISGAAAMEFVRLIFPYLIVKRPHAIVVGKFAEVRGPTPKDGKRRQWTEEMRSQALSLRKQMQELNKRGPTEYSEWTATEDAEYVEGRWVKPQMRLDGTSEPFSETWPNSGMVVAGALYPLQTLVPGTCGSGSGLWPTPVADGDRTTDYKQGGRSLGRAVRQWPTPKSSPSGPDYARAGRDGSGGDDLATAVARETFPTPCVADAEGGRTSKGSKRPDEAGLAVTVKRLLPTLTVQDAKNNGAASQHERNTKPLNAEVGGALNPAWVCWLMGWPPGWDSVEPMTADPATWTGSPEQWDEEPADVPRVATGIPDRVARLRMLGNGWVPQCAMWVARRVLRAVSEP